MILTTIHNMLFWTSYSKNHSNKYITFSTKIWCSTKLSKIDNKKCRKSAY